MISLLDLRAAQQRIDRAAVRTPLVRCGEDGLWLKAENLQPIGSFKVRGAYNKIASLSEGERCRGVIAHSSGNHAQGVAYAAKLLGVKATIVVPSNIPQIKLDATRAHGATIDIAGPASADRIRRADELAAQHDFILVPPYDDELVIAGQGTIGLEIVADLPDVDLVLVPVSGGGIISGIATAIKESKPSAKVVGVEPELAADAQESLRTGTRVTWPADKVGSTIADGLRANPVGAIPFEHIRKYVDDIVTVSEDDIRNAMRHIATTTRLIAEPSGAAAAAAWLYHRDRLPKAKCTVAILSGGNVAPEMLASVLK